MGIVSRLARSNTLVDSVTDNIVTDDTEAPGEGFDNWLWDDGGNMVWDDGPLNAIGLG